MKLTFFRISVAEERENVDDVKGSLWVESRSQRYLDIPDMERERGQVDEFKGSRGAEILEMLKSLSLLTVKLAHSPWLTGERTQISRKKNTNEKSRFALLMFIFWNPSLRVVQGVTFLCVEKFFLLFSSSSRFAWANLAGRVARERKGANLFLLVKLEMWKMERFLITTLLSSHKQWFTVLQLEGFVCCRVDCRRHRHSSVKVSSFLLAASSNNLTPPLSPLEQKKTRNQKNKGKLFHTQQTYTTWWEVFRCTTMWENEKKRSDSDLYESFPWWALNLGACVCAVRYHASWGDFHRGK